MNAFLLGWALLAAQGILATAMACAAFRIIRGPRAHDRVLGLDTLFLDTMLLMLTFGIRYESTFYFDAALVIALTGFVTTAAFAKFLMRGEVIE